MNDFCPDCGARFTEPRDLRTFWIRVLKCPSCTLGDFLEVGDSRWIFPLQRLELGSFQKIMAADETLLRTAVERVRRIDFKTVSIVDFEQTLSGSFDASRRYTITYPDGSTR
jgi:hypothetical protein